MSYKGKKNSNVYAPEEGYDIWASEYDKSLGYLDSFEGDKYFEIAGKIENAKIN